MIYAQVNQNKVVNIFEWKENTEPKLDKQSLLIEVSSVKPLPRIGDIYDYESKTFTTPTEFPSEETPEELFIKKLKETIDKHLAIASESIIKDINF